MSCTRASDEENFGVAQKEEKRAARCIRGIALENLEGQRANEEKEEEAARGTRASDGRKLCGGTEGRKKSGKRCTLGIA